jgi:hypothetical protein
MYGCADKSSTKTSLSKSTRNQSMKSIPDEGVGGVLAIGMHGGDETMVKFK